MPNNGFNNENMIISQIDNQYYYNLNTNFEKFIKFLEPKIKSTTKIYCEKIAGQNKPDVCIRINEKKYFVSIKSGQGNSVHQETIDEFINFISKLNEFTIKIENNFRFFIWGDGSIDGKGEINERISSSRIKRDHPELINSLNIFFDKNKKIFFERFVFSGTAGSISADYIYYGNQFTGVYAGKEKIMKFLCDSKNISKRSSVSLGPLSFQAWNRNLNGGDKSENKRGVIQIKWPNLGEHISEINNYGWN